MDTKLATKQIRIKQWSEIIHDCKESGLMVDEYCELHNVSRNKYYYWLREIKNKLSKDAHHRLLSFNRLSAENRNCCLYQEMSSIQ